MPKYSFNSPSSLVDKISFLENEQGTSRAYLHARADVNDNQLAGIITVLRHQGYNCVPYTLEGAPVVEVRGYKRPTKLLNTLREEHIVSGEPSIDRSSDEHISFKDKLLKRTLQLSAAFQVLGDIFYYKYNRMEGHSEGTVASYFYSLGTLAILTYGKNDQSEIQVHDMAKAFEHYLEKNNIKIPSDCALHSVVNEAEPNPLLKIHNFMKRYPSEMYNALTGMAGLMVAINAYKNHYAKIYPDTFSAVDIKALRKEGLQDMGLGLTTLASTMYGLFVKEKKPDADEPAPTNAVGKLIQYVRYNPLSVTGAGLLVSTLFHAASTMTAYKVAVKTNDALRKKSVPWRGAFVMTSLFAELLIMISSKGHGVGVTSDNTVQKTAYTMAAEVVLSRPESEREYMTNYIADFLQQPDILAEKRDVVITNLKKEIDQLKDNPWLCSSDKKSPSPEQESKQLAEEQHNKTDQIAKLSNHTPPALSWTENINLQNTHNTGSQLTL